LFPFFATRQANVRCDKKIPKVSLEATDNVVVRQKIAGSGNNLPF
jgi:hypothetical protein